MADHFMKYAEIKKAEQLLINRNLGFNQFQKFITDNPNFYSLVKTTDLLHHACTYQKDPKIFELLLKNAGDQAMTINSTLYNEIPMHYACRSQRDVKIFELLLKNGGDKLMTIKNMYGVTPMHYACRIQTDPKIIELLLKNGGDKAMTIKSYWGLTPVDEAIDSKGNCKILMVLIKSGVKLNKEIINIIKTKSTKIKIDFMKYLRKLQKYINKKDIEMMLRSLPRAFLSKQDDKHHDIASLVVKTTNKSTVKDFQNKLDILEDYLLEPKPRPQTEREQSSFKTNDFKYSKSLSSISH